MTLTPEESALIVTALDARESELLRRLDIYSMLDPYSAREHNAGELIANAKKELNAVGALRTRMIKEGA